MPSSKCLRGQVGSKFPLRASQKFNLFPGWKRFFDYAWTTFKTRFHPIIDNLKRHRALLSDEKLTVVIEEIQESRDVAEITRQQLSSDIKKQLDEIKQSLKGKDIGQRDSLLREKDFLVTKFEPPEYNADQHRAFSQRDIPSSGDWILEDPRFKNWVNGKTRAEDILYLNGMPGSGQLQCSPQELEEASNCFNYRQDNISFAGR